MWERYLRNQWKDANYSRLTKINANGAKDLSAHKSMSSEGLGFSKEGGGCSDLSMNKECLTKVEFDIFFIFKNIKKQIIALNKSFFICFREVSPFSFMCW